MNEEEIKYKLQQEIYETTWQIAKIVEKHTPFDATTLYFDYIQKGMFEELL